MSPDEAYIAARRQFGNTALLRQDIHEMNGIAWIEHTVQDLRHALRQLARSPAFAGIVIVTLALGIGSTTAIFSVVEAVPLRPLPYPEADRLVRIIERPAEQANDIGYKQSLAAVWTRDLPVLRAQAPTLSHVGVYSGVTATVNIDSGNSLRLEGSRISPSCLRHAWCSARARGRIFLTAEEAPSTEPAAGVLLALGTVSALRTLGTSLARQDLTPGVSIPRLEEIQIDGTALVFTVAITLCVGLLVGLLPIVRYALARHLDALKGSLSSNASAHAGPSRGGRAALLVAQTALATMALIGGGLLVHSFVKLANVDPGYEPANLLTFTLRSSSPAGSVPSTRRSPKAWTLPARYVGYEAEPARILGAMEWIYRQLP
jgi:hypothetical protein